MCSYYSMIKMSHMHLLHASISSVGPWPHGPAASIVQSTGRRHYS